jgi:hypothetical protein
MHFGAPIADAAHVQPEGLCLLAKERGHAVELTCAACPCRPCACPAAPCRAWPTPTPTPTPVITHYGRHSPLYLAIRFLCAVHGAGLLGRNRRAAPRPPLPRHPPGRPPPAKEAFRQGPSRAGAARLGLSCRVVQLLGTLGLHPRGRAPCSRRRERPAGARAWRRCGNGGRTVTAAPPWASGASS